MDDLDRVLRESLASAIRAPTNATMKPWHVFVVAGPARDRLVEALLDAAKATPPCGQVQHAADRGIAVLGNGAVFRAPLAGVVCLSRDLDHADSMGVGMFVQTLLLELTARGVGSCVEAWIAGYPDTIRSQLDVPNDMRILCGLAVGYPDPDLPGDSLPAHRNPVGDKVVFLED
jgi:nitroreductase